MSSGGHRYTSTTQTLFHLLSWFGSIFTGRTGVTYPYDQALMESMYNVISRTPDIAKKIAELQGYESKGCKIENEDIYLHLDPACSEMTIFIDKTGFKELETSVTLCPEEHETGSLPRRIIIENSSGMPRSISLVTFLKNYKIEDFSEHFKVNEASESADGGDMRGGGGSGSSAGSADDDTPDDGNSQYSDASGESGGSDVSGESGIYD